MRAIVEGIAQSNPLTGLLARLYQTTHPSKSEQDRDRWECEVTGRVNDLPSQDEWRQVSKRLSEVPTPGESFRNQFIIAGGEVRQGAIVSGHGMTSATDNGTGDWSVNLDMATDMPYHVSVEVPQGRANVLDKTTSGFRVRTSEDGEPADIDFDFAVIGRYPHP